MRLRRWKTVVSFLNGTSVWKRHEFSPTFREYASERRAALLATASSRSSEVTTYHYEHGVWRPVRSW